MAIRHYSEIEWYDSSGNLVRPGFVTQKNGDNIYTYKATNVLKLGSNLVTSEQTNPTKTGQTGIIIGSSNTFTHKRCIILGNNITSTNNDQLIAGQYNNKSQTGYLIVGTGTGVGSGGDEQKNRSGFRVVAKSNGDAEVHTEGDILLHSGASTSGAKIYYQNNAIIFDFVL